MLSLKLACAQAHTACKCQLRCLLLLLLLIGELMAPLGYADPCCCCCRSQAAYYCCKEHHVRHWQRHKQVCKHLQQLAAAVGDVINRVDCQSGTVQLYNSTHVAACVVSCWSHTM
jgi:hypothetical protein